MRSCQRASLMLATTSSHTPRGKRADCTLGSPDIFGRNGTLDAAGGVALGAGEDEEDDEEEEDEGDEDRDRRRERAESSGQMRDMRPSRLCPCARAVLGSSGTEKSTSGWSFGRCVHHEYGDTVLLSISFLRSC